jgi:hypothetical protein
METNAVVSMTPSIHFGAAPPHALYPLGGLRMSFVAKSFPIAVNANDVGAVVFTGSSTGNYGVNLNATAAELIGTSASVEYPSIFDSGGASGLPVATFGQFFRQYVVDEADIHFVSEIGPIDGTYAPVNLLFSREHDPYTAGKKAATTITNDSFVGEDCITFPAWTPQATYKVVPRGSASGSRDRELYYTTSVRDTIDLGTADEAANVRQTVQGVCYIVTDRQATAKVLGQLWVSATIDFYGFNQGGTGNIPARPRRLRADAKIDKRPADAGASPESKSFKDDYLVVDSELAAEQTPRVARSSQLPLSEPAALRRTIDIRHSADGLGGLPSSTRKA